MTFVKGDRVRVSDEGRRRGIRKMLPHTLGRVIGFSRKGYPRVTWDGQRPTTIMVYHPSYIERCEGD